MIWVINETALLQTRIQTLHSKYQALLENYSFVKDKYPTFMLIVYFMMYRAMISSIGLRSMGTTQSLTPTDDYLFLIRIMFVLFCRIVWGMLIVTCLSYFIHAVHLFMKDYSRKMLKTELSVKQSTNLTVTPNYNLPTNL